MSLLDVSMFYVLGEDPAHRSFIRAWLSANNVHHRRVYSIDPPAGKSGGIQFVLTRCKDTIKDALHRDRSKAKTRVVLAIDADDGTVEERLAEVKRELADISEEERQAVICFLIPKRHIETWVHALGSTDPRVNERDNYKDKTIDEVRAAARRLARLPSAPLEPPSLALAFEQLQHLKAT
jgi:hypothetical protein